MILQRCVEWMAVLKQSKCETEANHNAELKIEASLDEKGGLFSSLENADELSSRGYGVPENGKLMLTLYEGLFLLG